MSEIRAILFDVFGTVVDWRGSLIRDFASWGPTRGFTKVDWVGFVDAWRAAYVPSMERVRRGEVPWTNLDGLQRASLADLAPRFGLPSVLPEIDREYLVRGWHRLDPWPDSVLGLRRLKQQFIIAPLSNGSVALLVNMAKRAGLPWDTVLATELFRHYKPDPETYGGAAALLGLQPQEVMMAAAHNGDLRAARALGLRTAFFARATEHGPNQSRDLAAEEDWDVIATDIEDLATRLKA
ncbi:MAG TPA: haloacid dehalogenase type II [Acetobacteraceae bacterium]|jgi:2-haloacid dehalogenase|nr:haloacid dehalogenase type II [Acetobacteraceae bacterium]